MNKKKTKRVDSRRAIEGEIAAKREQFFQTGSVAAFEQNLGLLQKYLLLKLWLLFSHCFFQFVSAVKLTRLSNKNNSIFIARQHSLPRLSNKVYES